MTLILYFAPSRRGTAVGYELPASAVTPSSLRAQAKQSRLLPRNWIASLALLAMTIAMLTAFQTPTQITFKTL